ncbi:MAG: Dihydrolipoyllysine-residue acetyltransferase component of pyruvate dehydrogenase complex [Chlamydiales bacterium]|nr:Dihydrolipoyllysine-residue acetyltransferase component of pyruvate dehydrogenase complex [Chlamydiales bacterium]MCH9619239.1 Dihydrolipoyllysine-residue acetyltransferase component of pyruvate dehydrogenase complex [Chlamydiales bacterium]MCH9622501.1 Dihydrolipoyllysine-residue acetyltransferase component of pyruvate dehydrogenase complex [Chlamydiales bacterium]
MTEVKLPKLGESIVGATVVQWLKKEGESVALDESLLEVATDKVNSEIPSPVAGVLKKILVEVDEEVEVGAPLAVIDSGEEEVEAASEKVVAQSPPCPASVDFSPAVLRVAKMEGLDLETLRKIEGTGEGGRVTKKDIQSFTKKMAKPSETSSGEEERIALSGMRKAIADNMVRSFYEAPHASFVTEIDLTEVMEMIAKQKARFLETHDAKLTITSFIIQALTKAVQQFPMLNASLDDETIVMKRYVNVGIAVNIEKGLMVPVIKNCQERNLVSIAKSIAELSTKARSNKLAPDDVQGGTITLTNFGMTGILMGVPIIHYPEVAIIGLGGVQKRVVVKEDNSFAVRHMAYVSVTFDHRVVDGVYVCDFLNAFKHHIESAS